MLLFDGKLPEIVGDTRPMLRARRRFLERGNYEPLSEAVIDTIVRALGRRTFENLVVADVGCGEGYFLGRLQGRLTRRQSAAATCVFGVDISKEAIRQASKQHRSIRFVVADVWKKLPFANGSVDVLLDMFSPRNAFEFHRVTCEDGLLLVVIPGHDHLSELRNHLPLLGIEQDKKRQIERQLTGSFALSKVVSLTTSLDLESESLGDLLTMTPNYWHLTEDALGWLQTVHRFRVTASFELILFRRIAADLR